MRTFVLFAGIAGMSIWSSLLAQNPPLPSLNLPEGEGSWVMRITTSGGFTGQGRGDATLTSLGERNCSQSSVNCSSQLTGEKLQSLKDTALRLEPGKWMTVVSYCNDCFITTVVFLRRENGSEKSYSVTWSDANKTGVPTELVRIVESALTGKW